MPHSSYRCDSVIGASCWECCEAFVAPEDTEGPWSWIRDVVPNARRSNV